MTRWLVLIVLLATPATAHAGTVAREGTEIVYRSAPGEADDFTAQANPPDPETPIKLYFDAKDAPITPGPGCVQGGRYPECPLDGVTAIRVLAGDGDDKVVVLSRIPLIADLGPGEDEFTGRGAIVEASGGEGADVVHGELGGGTLDGGPGNDAVEVFIASTYTGPLVAAGGDGNDRISISGHAEPSITLSGGAGDDTITAQLFESDNGMAVFCGPGVDRTRLRLADNLLDGCAPALLGFDPSRVPRVFREGDLGAPARVEHRLPPPSRRRPRSGGGAGPWRREPAPGHVRDAHEDDQGRPPLAASRGQALCQRPHDHARRRAARGPVRLEAAMKRLIFLLVVLRRRSRTGGLDLAVIARRWCSSRG